MSAYQKNSFIMGFDESLKSLEKFFSLVRSFHKLLTKYPCKRKNVKTFEALPQTLQAF